MSTSLFFYPMFSRAVWRPSISRTCASRASPTRPSESIDCVRSPRRHDRLPARLRPRRDPLRNAHPISGSPGRGHGPRPAEGLPALQRPTGPDDQVSAAQEIRVSDSSFPSLQRSARWTGGGPVWIVEGEEEGRRCGPARPGGGWFLRDRGLASGRQPELLADFEAFRLRGRTVELVPDGDWRTNPGVTRGPNGSPRPLRRGARACAS